MALDLFPTTPKVVLSGRTSSVPTVRCPACSRNFFRPGYGHVIETRGFREEVCGQCAEAPRFQLELDSRASSGWVLRL